MSLTNLLHNYRTYIKFPWKTGLSDEQRTIFCIYDKQDELKLRYKLTEFSDATESAKHSWYEMDISKAYPDWLEKLDYLEEYFENPGDMTYTLLTDFLEHIKRAIEKEQPDDNTVFAIYGVGALLGVAKVRALVENVTPVIRGRLVVFFPGTHKGNTFSLMDAYESWGYLATTLDGEQIK